MTNYTLKIQGSGNRDQLVIRLMDLARAIQTADDGGEIDLKYHHLEYDGILDIKVEVERVQRYTRIARLFP